MHRSKDTFSLFSSLRNRVQLVLFALTLAIGLQFYLFVGQAQTGASMTIQRPAGVEGFLPIGALLGWKQFLTTGIWDAVHPAAMVILLYAAMISFLFRKAFCAWFCPVGTLSEWLWKMGHRLLGKNIRIPVAIDWPLRSLKYLLLSFFVFVTVTMAPGEIASFLKSPYYKLADVKMLHFFTRMGMLTFVTLVVLIGLSMFIRNFWCRYLCPYGALMGLLALFSPAAIHRRPSTCTNCLQCSQSCPSHLPVHRKISIRSPECSGCMDCIHACPSANTLSLKTFGSGTSGWVPSKLAAAVVVIFALMVFGANITGHWKSGVGETEFKVLLKHIDAPMMVHPTF